MGDDIGTGGSYRVGVSTLRTSTDGSGTALVDIDDRTGTISPFVGDTRLYGVDFVYKWAPDGNPKYRNFKLIAEWFTARRDGTLIFDQSGALGWVRLRSRSSCISRAGTCRASTSSTPNGEWACATTSSTKARGMPGRSPRPMAWSSPISRPRRYSAMIDWNPSEFSRLRLQFNQDKSQLGINDNQIFLQYVYSLGSHGAHKF